MKKIGIVTITYNSEKYIEAFLKCTLAQTYSNFVLYIIDNISTDNTLQQVAIFTDSRIKIIANEKNVGVAAGNNQGILAALQDNCELIMLLNNDVEYEKTLYEKLVNQIYELDCSLITPKMMYYPETNLIWYAGANFNKNNFSVAPHIGIQEEDKGQFDTIQIFNYAPTCCVLLKKEVIDDIGLMDEKYFAYFDDTDFFYRIYKHQKHKMYYYPFVQFYHKVGGLTNSKTGNAKKFKFNNFYIHLITRNQIYFLKKQHNLQGYWNIVYTSIYTIIRFLFSGKYVVNFDTFKLICKSIYEGLKM